MATVIPDERAETLSGAFVQPLKAPGLLNITIRTDNVSAFISIHCIKTLKPHSISLELRQVKNANKNPVTEKAIKELETEIKTTGTNEKPISLCQLTIAVAHLCDKMAVGSS